MCVQVCILASKDGSVFDGNVYQMLLFLTSSTFNERISAVKQKICHPYVYVLYDVDMMTIEMTHQCPH